MSIPITLLTGYLGSGKTTLINNILNNKDNLKIAVIVNDIGEVNIDASLIERGGVVASDEKSLVSLQNGCICCTLNTDLIEQINNLIKLKKFDYIVIEASGVCEPLPIAQTITMMEDACTNAGVEKMCYLDSVVTVVDAKRMIDEFTSLEGETYEYSEDDIENLIINQLEFCNTIVLNKIDEVSKEELETVKNIINKLQPVANIIETNYSKVDMKDILNVNKFDLEEITMSNGWYKELIKEEDEHEHEHKHEHEHEHEHDHETCTNPNCKYHHRHEHGETLEYGINTFVYYERKPFDRVKFYDYINKPWSKNIIRTKGILYFKDDIDMSYVFEQSGSLKDLYEGGTWLKSESEDFQNAVLQNNPDLRKDWDSEYGDMMIKLVFIGKNIDKDIITNELNKCL